ncbi:MAG: proline dehydrogenase family protein [Bacteroidetes bacterium]|nr:proline dehydrogenase family protein [Bacteroidota bacterium]
MAQNTSQINLDFNNTKTAYGYLSDKQLNSAIKLFKMFNYPFLVKYGPKFAGFSMKVGIPVKGLIKKTIFAHFCGGESIIDSKSKINFLFSHNVKTILDYAVEGEESEAIFDATCQEVIRTVEESAVNEAIPFAVFKPTGVARFALLQKVSAGQTLTSEEQAEFERVRNRFDTICKKGSELNVQVLIDAEHSWIQLAIDNLVLEMSEKYNKERALIFNTLQLYRHDRVQFLKDCFEKYKFPLAFKFVRGAYMEIERERAAQMNYKDPINPDKAATDRDFDEAVSICLHNIDRCEVLIGTHNEASCIKAAELMAKLNIAPNDKRVYFSQLLGMSDNISFIMAKAGYNVAKYVPYGPVSTVLPYLSRRAQENSSIAGQSSRQLQLLIGEKNRRSKS